MSKAFCSRNCKENYFQLIAIQIPKLFLKRIYLFCNEEEREQEILDFASRHNWKLDLLRTKIKDEAVKMGYTSENPLEKN